MHNCAPENRASNDFSLHSVVDNFTYRTSLLSPAGLQYTVAQLATHCSNSAKPCILMFIVGIAGIFPSIAEKRGESRNGPLGNRL